MVEDVAKGHTWSERQLVSVNLVVLAIHELGRVRVQVLHVLIAGVHGRPRDADLLAGVVPNYASILNRNGYECEKIGPDFWDPPTQKGDHFPVTVFKPSLKKT